MTDTVNLVQKIHQACMAINPALMVNTEVSVDWNVHLQSLMVALQKHVWVQPLMGRTVKVPRGVRNMHFEAWVGYPNLVIPGQLRTTQWSATPIYPDEEF